MGGDDIDANLIFGWEIDSTKLKEFLAKNKQTDCEYYGYCSFTNCWCKRPQRIFGFPNYFNIFGCYQYRDQDLEEVQVFLSATNQKRDTYTMEEFQNILNSVDMDEVRKFAVQLGAKDEPPKFIVKIHVW